MPESKTLRDSGHDYTASVGDADDLTSPVTVTSGSYTIRFDGNGFASKHLRRIRSRSVSALQQGDISSKFSEYLQESSTMAVSRFAGNEHATSTFVFLDLGQFCQFGCQIIKFLDTDRNQWVRFGRGASECLQKELTVTLGNCFASSNTGYGEVRENAATPERLQHGIGIRMRVTLKQPLGGDGRNVQVCHYAGGNVLNEFAPESLSGATYHKLKNLGGSIVTG